MKILVRRVYEPPADADGQRVLVDRLWPRGLNRERARIDLWARDIAPSAELRRWYGHDPARWDEFRRRYEAELLARPSVLEDFIAHLDPDTVTLLYGSREARFNNAHALAGFLERRFES